ASAEAELQVGLQHLQGVAVEGLHKGIRAIVENGGSQDAGLDIVAAAVGGNHHSKTAGAARPGAKGPVPAGPSPKTERSGQNLTRSSIHKLIEGILRPV